MHFGFHHISESTIEVFCEEKDLDLYVSLANHIKSSKKVKVEEMFALPHLLYINYRLGHFDLDMFKSVLDDFNYQRSVESQELSVFKLPVCFDESFALDREIVEKETGLDFSQVISVLKQSSLMAAMYGFLPGFIYISGLHESLQIPRKPEPSQHIPPGSVAVANNYAGVYPTSSPGGWYVLGRTPVKIFDSTKDEMFRIVPGQKVEFVEISKEDFDTYG